MNLYCMELANRYLQTIAHIECVTRGFVTIVIVIDFVNAAIKNDGSLCGRGMSVDGHNGSWEQSVKQALTLVIGGSTQIQCLTLARVTLRVLKQLCV